MPPLPPEFESFIRWGVLFVPVVFALSAFSIRRRAAGLVAMKRLTEEERDAFTRGVVIVVAIGGLLGALVLYLTPSRDIFGVLRLPPTSLAGWIQWTTIALGYLLWFLWLWRGNGATLLARIAPAAIKPVDLNRTFDPGRVRLACTLFGVGTLIVNVVLAIVGPSVVLT